jgi:hypothetical protein
MKSAISNRLMSDWMAVSNYPGAELVLPGLRDLAEGRVTIASCLVSIARPLLERTGLVERSPSLPFVAEPERVLYRLLQEEGGNAYGRYNSLLRRLISFEKAAALLKGRAAPSTSPAAPA